MALSAVLPQEQADSEIRMRSESLITHGIQVYRSNACRATLACLFACSACATLAAGETFPVTNYAAACNASETGGGTDDTKAFIAAAAAADSAYVASGAVQKVVLPAGKPCRVDGIVTIGSGVVFEGPGIITVSYQRRETLKFVNADNGGVENLTIIVLAGPGGNHAEDAAIKWTDTTDDSQQHHDFFARNNTITDGSWGILVSSDSGSGSLRNVDISNNTVASRIAYTNADGIHVNGNVHEITIKGNHISNRHDAAIALTSGPGKQRTLSGAIVSDNICIDDITGLDNSGATNAVWSNNYVKATASFSNGSNPAARSITYVGLTPQNVKFIGNYLENYQGEKTDVTAKVSDDGSNLVTNVEWAGNTIVGTQAMWLAGDTITVNRNTFSPGAIIVISYDGVNQYPGQNISIGLNYWKGSGTISAPGNPGLYKNLSLARQQAAGKINVVGQSNFHH
jgi:hypothetical protein